jgi:crotonobetainyl-CoA:carnitine CoA-transferase CaiB-like acyl-CoA transferase
VDCLQKHFATKSRAEALEWLAALDVCFAPVNTLTEALADPNVNARHLVLADERGRKHLATPIRFAAEPARPVLREPLLGEHTESVLAKLDG